jgi:hypothetical protein
MQGYCAVAPEGGERPALHLPAPATEPVAQRATKAIERLHEKFSEGLQTMLPSADTASMLFWAPLASGQVKMRKVDGWQTPATKPIDQTAPEKTASASAATTATVAQWGMAISPMLDSRDVYR